MLRANGLEGTLIFPSEENFARFKASLSPHCVRGTMPAAPLRRRGPLPDPLLDLEKGKGMRRNPDKVLDASPILLQPSALISGGLSYLH
jgi:hypothetical protein